MRGHPGSVEILARAVLEEFGDLDPARLTAALERGVARAASATLNTEGHRIIDLHLARVEATEEAAERARILRELSASLEEDRGDAERALAVRLAAWSEAGTVEDVEPLLRLARVTERSAELPLAAMTAVLSADDVATPDRLVAIAKVWQQVGREYAAADCLERALALAPAHTEAHEALELFYRSTGEWPVLIELLARRAMHVEPKECAELFRELAGIYERELGDDLGALDAYREADRLAPDHPDVLDAIARVALSLGDVDGEALATLERLVELTRETKARARMQVRAAEAAKLSNWDRAQALFEAALVGDPDLPSAVDGLASLMRDRGEFAQALELLLKAAARPPLVGERSRWLADAADYAVATADFERAKALYREARIADPTNDKAGLALVELHWDTGSLSDLVPVLDELIAVTAEQHRLHAYLRQRAKVATELGETEIARTSLARAVEIVPDDRDAALELVGLQYEHGEWAATLALVERLLDHEDLLPTDAPIELHFQAARSARELGELERAVRHAGVTLALAPDHRGALLLRQELDTADPFAHAATELQLANLAPAAEKGVRFAALGDRYLALGDRATALEMYREALVHRPHDHILLTKALNLVVEEGDYSYALDIVERLVASEKDAKVRARYYHLAGQIARDELADVERAIRDLTRAVEADPALFAAADELEALLAAADEREALVAFYYGRLEAMRTTEARERERLRLWDALGAVCLALGRRDDAIAALEVGLSLAPDDTERRRRLADLYVEGGAATHAASALVQHHAVLREDHRRDASYDALRILYERLEQPDRATAVAEAAAVIRRLPASEPVRAVVPDKVEATNRASAAKIAALFDPSRNTGAEPTPARGLARPLLPEDWGALSRIDVDSGVSALFALVAPAFALDRARVRTPLAMPNKENELPPAVARTLARVIASFGIARPPAFVDRDQRLVAKVVMRHRDGALLPALTIGGGAASTDEHELAFRLARALADLRSDRIARLLCPRPGELAQILELVLAYAADTSSPASRWLATTLHPLELDQTLAIAARLRDRGDKPLRAAQGWLAATERAADRVGFVVAGDLSACARSIAAEPGVDPERAPALVWAATTEELLGVRFR